MSTMINKCIRFVKVKHSGQLYDDQPYFIHLARVVKLIKKYAYLIPANMLEICILAGYLHDIIEDTDTSYNDIKNLFGVKVANIVYNLTDEQGKNRKERKAKTYPKIMNDQSAIFIKLCDRLANISHEKAKLNEMYKKEHQVFKYFLYSKKYDDLWVAIDKIINP